MAIANHWEMTVVDVTMPDTTAEASPTSPAHPTVLHSCRRRVTVSVIGVVVSICRKLAHSNHLLGTVRHVQHLCGAVDALFR